jgi:hypothetical protein
VNGPEEIQLAVRQLVVEQFERQLLLLPAIRLYKLLMRQFSKQMKLDNECHPNAFLQVFTI